MLIPKILSEGYEVTGIDNFIYNNRNVLLSHISHPNFTFIEGDVRNEIWFKNLVAQFDIIIPCAALVGMPTCDKNPVDAELVNFKQIENICNMKTEDQKLIYFNSNSRLWSNRW